MEYTTIEKINQYEGTTINPMKMPDNFYELYSVPSFESGHPEIIKGSDIGSSKITVAPNDILICKINPRINRIWVVGDESDYEKIASSEWIVVRTKDFNPEFLKWYFSSRRFINLMTSEITGIGGSLTRAQPKRVKQYPVPVVPIEQQNHIVSMLNKLKAITDNKKKEIDDLNMLIKSRFVEMFGTYPNNEKNWPTGTIRDLVTDVRYGSSRKAADGNNGKYPYLRMNNITYGGELDLTDVKTIDVPENELSKCTVKRGDLLFNRTNSKELVGKTCVYNRDETMVLAGFIIRVRLNNRALPEFVSSFLNTDFSKQMLLGMCKTAIGQANINAQEMQNIGIYIPPIDLQKDFVKFKDQVDKSKSTAIHRYYKLIYNLS